LLASQLVRAENTRSANAVCLQVRVCSDTQDATLSSVQPTLAHDALTFDGRCFVCEVRCPAERSLALCWIRTAYHLLLRRLDVAHRRVSCFHECDDF